MRGIAPDKMTVEQLREAVSVMSRRGGGLEPTRLTAWSRKKCTDWLNANSVPNLKVGDFCKSLLRVVVGKTEDNQPIGLSYIKMVEIAKNHYPCSDVDANHVRWYANRMRADGEVFPVHREASKWKVMKGGKK